MQAVEETEDDDYKQHIHNCNVKQEEFSRTEEQFVENVKGYKQKNKENEDDEDTIMNSRSNKLRRSKRIAACRNAAKNNA